MDEEPAISGSLATLHFIGLEHVGGDIPKVLSERDVLDFNRTH